MEAISTLQQINIGTELTMKSAPPNITFCIYMKTDIIDLK